MKTCTGTLRPDHNWNCLSQKSRSHSHAKGHFLHLTPTPRYAGSQFSTVRGESGVSTLITAQLMSFKKAGGVTHCIRGRDIWLRQIHPQALWGAWHFQDTENKLPLRREYAFSVGKKIKNKKKKDGENWRGSIRAHLWLKAHNQGNFRPFRKGESIKMSSGSQADPRNCTYTEKTSVLTQQSLLDLATTYLPFNSAHTFKYLLRGHLVCGVKAILCGGKMEFRSNRANI